MRLIKLAFYAILGYVLYEMYLGIREGKRSGGSGGGGNRGELSRALNDDEQGRIATLTGPGRGTVVATDDSDGQSVRHVVGRGVVTN